MRSRHRISRVLQTFRRIYEGRKHSLRRRSPTSVRGSKGASRKADCLCSIPFARWANAALWIRKMTGTKIELWTPSAAQAIPDTLSDPGQIASRALQLRDRERTQIATNFEAGNFELAASFVWMRTMALLKKQLAA